MNENLDTMTIEIEQEMYAQMLKLCQNLGTTIEDMAAAFCRFCVISENLPLLKAYFGIENTPADAGTRTELEHLVFQKVFAIAAKRAG